MARRRTQNQRLLPQSRSRRWKKTRRVVGYPSYGSYRRVYFKYGMCVLLNTTNNSSDDPIVDYYLGER